MGILNLGNSEEFEEFEDDSQYYEFSSNDEFDDEGVGSGNGHKRAIGMGFAAAVLFIGAAFGAKLALTTSSSLEFGTGQSQTVTCNNSSYPLTITPFAGYINDTGTAGHWTLDSVYIEGINPACINTNFSIQVFDNTPGSSALSNSDSATSKAATPYTYKTYDAAKFYIGSDSSTVNSLSSAYTDIENATDPTADSSISVQVTFDPDLVADFANAQSVYKIVVQTTAHYASDPIN